MIKCLFNTKFSSTLKGKHLTLVITICVISQFQSEQQIEVAVTAADVSFSVPYLG